MLGLGCVVTNRREVALCHDFFAPGCGAAATIVARARLG